MCVEIQFCTHHRLWDVLFSLNKSRSLSTTGQALWHLYILSPVIFPLTHMYSVEPSSQRLNCTEVETGQRRKAPSPRCIILFNSFIHGKTYQRAVVFTFLLVTKFGYRRKSLEETTVMCSGNSRSDSGFYSLGRSASSSSSDTEIDLPR